MPKIAQSEIRENAQRFVHDNRDIANEQAEAQTFWNDFFRVFGVERRKVAAFEKAVRKLGGGRGRIDVFWSGVLLVEHKSRGESLDKAALQAFDYIPNLDDRDAPQYVLVSDFANFRLYDLDNDAQIDFTLEEFPNQINLFGFISGWERRTYEDQDPINIQVANTLADLHNALRDNRYDGHDLEVFLIRLVYCLFADDTGIFPRDHFRVFLEERTNENGSDTGAMLNFLFNEILNRPPENRQTAHSNNLVYNNYPFPQDVSDRRRERVERAAQAVLDARADFPDETLANLYDPDLMPLRLQQAHRTLDTAVDACYGRRQFNTDLERLEFLFDLYRQYIEPLRQLAERETRRATRRRR